MEHTWRALELKGEVDEQGGLRLDVPLPIKGPRQIQLVVLLPDEGDEREQTEDGSSVEPVVPDLTLWHDFRESRAMGTKIITLGFLEKPLPAPSSAAQDPLTK